MFTAPNGDQFPSKEDYRKFIGYSQKQSERERGRLQANVGARTERIYNVHKTGYKKPQLCPNGCGRTENLTYNHAGKKMCVTCYWNEVEHYTEK